LHIEAHMAPVRPLVEQYRRMLPLLAGGALGLRRGEAPAIDEAFRAGIDDLADFTGDAETIAVDAMIADAQASVTVTSGFRATPVVAGKGVDLGEAAKAAAAMGAAKDDAAREEAERVAGEKASGWLALQLEAPAAKTAACAKEWAAAWGRPGVAKWVKAQVHD